MRRPTIATTLILAGALLAAAPTTAAARADEFEAHAEGEGFLLSIPDVVDVGGGSTQADLTSGPTAHARGAGFLASDPSISEVTIERNGVSDRDPAEGRNCGGPELPAPLDLADLACSFAAGDTTGATSSSRASATGAEVDVTGADVAALVEFLLGSIDESELGGAIDTIESEVIAPAIDAFAAACADLEDSPLGDLGTTAGELIDALEDQGAPVDVQLDPGEPCTFLVQYVTDPPIITDDPIGVLQTALTDALDGVSILDVTLAGSDSATDEATAAVTATASALGLDVALPSLNLLGNLVDVLRDLATAFLTTVEDDIATLETPPELPYSSPDEIVDALMEGIPQELQDVLSSEDPLLRVTGGRADASATYDRDAEEVTTDGTVAPLVIDLNDDLAALLMLSDQDPLTVPEGGSETIAAGTPLESTFTLAACTSEDAEEGGLPGARIHCAGLDLVLLKGVIGDDPDTDAPDGGLRVAGAAATAAAFGEAVAAAPPDDEGPLPDTGGGLALVGLVALGAAAALHRRR